MMKIIRYFQFILISLIFLCATNIYAGSGGPLSPAQAAYNVNYYDLDLEIFPTTKTIMGSLLCRVEIINPIDTLLLDLDDPFTVDSVLFETENGDFVSVVFDHSDEKLFIDIPGTAESGDWVTVKVFYYGPPRIASNPPWGVGFVWEVTPAGDPWLAVACEDQGGDIWWPCKDHPSDEPDSMMIRFTVPKPLICVSNGRYLGETDNGNGTTTFDWFISTPINNYNVTFYAAAFDLIEDEYISVSGDTIPFYFWVIPEYYQTAVNYMDVFLEEFDFLESICGPFPFGDDKHGWAHAPYWGMEHQTIIAYGHNFTTNNWGYDYIHYHELAHEWWGNLITAKDWSDVWIHEGIATYTEALYVEHQFGLDGYLTFMEGRRPNDNHNYPLAPYDELTASEAFDHLNPYSRGAAVMHTLRYHLGDEIFFELLERWAYPDSTDYDNTSGRQCRILTTDDMKIQAEEVTGLELDPFFDVFFREAAYPELHVVREIDSAVFTWETESNVLLDVDIPIVVNGFDEVVEMTEGEGYFHASLYDNMSIDPDKWILMARPYIVVSVDEEVAQNIDFELKQNYPNPFTQNTTFEYSIPEKQYVRLKIFDIVGREVKSLINEEQARGNYTFSFSGVNLPEGTYFYRLQAGKFVETKRLVVFN